MIYKCPTHGRFEEKLADCPTCAINCREDAPTEEDRQMILLALAELSLRRPGWLYALGCAADKFQGREMFNAFRETSADLIVPVEGPDPELTRGYDDAAARGGEPD